MPSSLGLRLSLRHRQHLGRQINRHVSRAQPAWAISRSSVPLPHPSTSTRFKGSGCSATTA